MSTTSDRKDDRATHLMRENHQPERPAAASPAADRGKRPPRGEPVVDRALAVLSAFDEEHPRLSLTELARRAGLPVSTAHRLVERLLIGGALERAVGGGYVIGARLFEIGSLAPRARRPRDAALPVMNELQVPRLESAARAAVVPRELVVDPNRDFQERGVLGE